MDTLTINKSAIKVNEEGYFTDPSQWNEDIAVEMAKQQNIDLSEKHFEVLHFLRNKYAEEVPLTIRKVGKSGIVDIKEFYKLFPGGPLKISSKIAGIPKPVSCV
ncbi:TusE/DsrC/DsvC family sulfur relay protein [Marivirga salinae]|uniref:TusE/DsrC/DsvC family sulfur relay protein n=1 Tax=Marivirga salinarum TaxID=3059078 RepID=A0AA49JGJ9_9BACT|nr:TusE/DsrC/DsvC family sulfur relay protein [Marivirga sp. BDSF4-3]WKK74355.2 TusE/DsrC/DsvC family sulfur relay protein [Marivirga sp. BDSF4-3]